MLGGSVRTVEKNMETSVFIGKEIGLVVNAGKTKYMVMSRAQNAGRSHSMKNDNSSFERVEELNKFWKKLNISKFYSRRN